jgi:hypothetical protein
MSTPGFFTQGVTYELPHPPVDERTVLIVHAVIGHALDLLRTEPPPGFDLATAKEDVVTVHLQHVVENRLRKTGEVPGFDQRSFGRLWREPKVVSYDMRHLDKMPDMIFHLNRDSLAVLSTEDGLFVECKPADKAHPAGQDYCDAGVRRFVDGEYAWAMQDAMMVCYSRDGRTIPDHLVPALAQRHSRLGVQSAPSALASSHATMRAAAVHRSVHGRSFSWPGPWGRACAIRIYHSWHSCS